MKIKILGTAASECMPAVFCNCPVCKRVREIGGKDVRSRSQTLINDDLLIDINSDTYHHTVSSNVDLSKVGYALITHSHNDHFIPQELKSRGKPFAWDYRYSVLDIYGNQSVLDKFSSIVADDGGINQTVAPHLALHLVEPFVPFSLGGYTITPLKAMHAPNQVALLYLIREGDSCLFYCNDTGPLPEETKNYLTDNKIRVDCILMDCTMGKIQENKFLYHMTYKECRELKAWLIEKQIMDEKSGRFVVTHFSHNEYYFYDELKKLDKTITVAYDGIELNI